MDNEEKLYAWCLEQRLLAGADVLELWKERWLDRHAPGWQTPVTPQDLAYAVTSDDPNLVRAFEAWWNANECSPLRLTIEELRLRIAVEAATHQMNEELEGRESS
ncbi:hypothetical protein ACFQ9V_08735 [Leifsonia sp. NPDC056665]|uniref:hypothetical protein n=1 Tax=Leifsonia sp. NPDC056665 TaxID=3345901 RepID=UPI00368BA90B